LSKPLQEYKGIHPPDYSPFQGTSFEYIACEFQWLEVVVVAKKLQQPQGCPNMLQITSSCNPILPSKFVFKYWDIIYMFRA
jgi:hypothetical protein